MSGGGIVIGFMSAPGGVGKTVLSLLTGWFLRRRGHRVLLIDLDPSISLALYLVRNEYELVDLERRGKTITVLIQKVVKKGERVDLRDYIVSRKFPSSNDPEIDALIPDINLTTEIDTLWYGAKARREMMLRRLLEGAEIIDEYDYVVVDTIPFFDKKYAIMLMYAADFCVIPLRPTIIDVYRTDNMLSQLPSLCDMKTEEVYDKLGLVFNMVDRRSSVQEKLVKTVREFFCGESPSVYVFEEIVPYLIAFQRIGTREERGDDRRTVEKNFEPFFEEFLKWIGTESNP